MTLDPQQITAQQLQDPSLTPDDLGIIAYLRPDLWNAIVVLPHCPQGLAQWIYDQRSERAAASTPVASAPATGAPGPDVPVAGAPTPSASSAGTSPAIKTMRLVTLGYIFVVIAMFLPIHRWDSYFGTDTEWFVALLATPLIVYFLLCGVGAGLAIGGITRKNPKLQLGAAIMAILNGGFGLFVAFLFINEFGVAGTHCAGLGLYVLAVAGLLMIVGSIFFLVKGRQKGVQTAG
ncbi:MAG: hypothetical protein GX483_07810 [Actinomycetaceae bacterium]|nr:hypothetical protein [Actinomycetaceae bacterium]